MKARTKILAASLCCLLAASWFAGCTGNGGQNNWDGEVDTSLDGSAYDETEDETVTKLTVFKNDWDQFNNAAKAGSPIYTAIKNKVGVDIEAMNTGGSQFEDMLSLMQAEGDLPDIFLTNGPDNVEFFNRLIRNGDALPISDWVNEEHYPNINKHLKKYEFLRYNLTYGQGKAWFIPSAHHNEKSLYVRQDWIDNLNAKLADCLIGEGVIASAGELTAEVRDKWQYKTPSDLLEFYRLARAFTLYDPDGNGQNDTYGYISESNKDMDAWIYHAFGAGWKDFMRDDETNEFTHADVHDGSKYATHFVTRLISEGYMSVDSLTGDNGGKQDKFSTGKAGMMYAHNWLNVIVSNIKSVDKSLTIEEATAKVALVAPPVGKDGTFYERGAPGFWQGFCINANASKSRIRKCLELYDFLLSEEGYELLQYGVKGTHFDLDGEGNKTCLLPLETDGFTKSLQVTDTASMLYALVDWTMHYKVTTGTNADIISVREAQSESLFKPAEYPCLQTQAVIDKNATCHDLFEETVAVLEKNENGKYYKPQDNKDATRYNAVTFGWDQLYDVGTLYNKYWNDYVQRYMNAGGTQMLQEYNDYVNSGKAFKTE